MKTSSFKDIQPIGQSLNSGNKQTKKEGADIYAAPQEVRTC